MKTTLTAMMLAVLLFASVPEVGAQITVKHSLVNRAGLEVFFLKNFDITRPGSGPPIFFIDITNTGPARTGVVLEMAVVSQRHGPLSRGRTRPFTLAAGEMQRLSNNDIFTNAGRFALDEYQFDEQLVDKLFQEVLSTGKLPTDVYSFNVAVMQPTGTRTSDSFDIHITNPHKLDLIFPGGPASSSMRECPKVFTRLPQFRWESDARIFNVIIAEARPGEDPEGALNQEPRFVRTFVIRNNRTPGVVPQINGPHEILPATTFQFPASGEVLQLRPGKVYYWRVLAQIETSSGRLPLESEIFCFRVAKLDNVGGKGKQVELVLRTLLGPDYDKLFGEGGELENFEAKRMTFAGKEVTVPELMRKLPKLRRGYEGFRIE